MVVLWEGGGKEDEACQGITSQAASAMRDNLGLPSLTINALRPDPVVGSSGVIRVISCPAQHERARPRD